MKDTKILIAKDIMEIKAWFRHNNLMKEFTKCIENLGQQNYSSDELMIKTLMYKSKDLLLEIRDKTLKICYEIQM